MTSRVYRLSSGLKGDYRAARDSLSLKTTQFVEMAITGQLPAIEAELLAIGLGLPDVRGGDQTVKFEISEVDIASMNETARKTGVPAITLFRLCLCRSSATVAEKPRRRRARK